VTVQVSNGHLRGQGGSVRRWLGVPYAEPPVGSMRWRAPQPAADWLGVRDALRFGLDPLQSPSPFSRAPGCDEDCLTLNIWSPDGARRAPVMVWVPGGGFMGGSASDRRSDGARLAAQGVVVVAINYRVGLAGFLAHPGLSAESEHGTSGNYGLLDQLAALEWVQKNIAAFGGDPQRVTAFGCSAGAASLSLLMTVPQARGLFHNAILQSPGAFRPLASLGEAEAAGASLVPDVKALRAMTAEQLLSLSGGAAGAGRSLTGPRVLRPIRDGHVIARDELDAERAGLFADLPLITGNVIDEGSFFLARMPVDGREGLARKLEMDFRARAGEALALYGAASDADAPRCMADVFGDTQFTWATRHLADTWARRGSAPAYRYVFGRRPAHAESGPTHTSEIAYVFGTLDDIAPREVHDDADRALSLAIQQAWVRFADSGNPNGAGLPVWSPTSPGEHQHLKLDVPIGAGFGWREAHMTFLDSFFGADRQRAAPLHLLHNTQGKRHG
jgi:para-nitrobenzyl esterase